MVSTAGNDSDIALNALRDEILSESIRPGSKLTEADLARRFETSRTPIRDALKALSYEGLVKITPNRGAFSIGLTKADLSDLYDLRADSEYRATYWAVERFYPEELEALEECFEMMSSYAGRGDAIGLSRLDVSFHSIIRSAAHNRILSNDIDRYTAFISKSKYNKQCSSENVYDIFSELGTIFEAFVNISPKDAAEAMRTHILGAKSRALGI